jgi:hypothetical protein
LSLDHPIRPRQHTPGGSSIRFAVVKLIIRKDFDRRQHPLTARPIALIGPFHIGQQLFSNATLSAQQVKRSVSRNWDLPTIQVSWRVRDRPIIIFILVQY